MILIGRASNLISTPLCAGANVHPPQVMSAFLADPQMPSIQQPSAYPSQAMSAFPTDPQMPSMQQPSVYSPSALWMLLSGLQTSSGCSIPLTHSVAMGCRVTEPCVSQYPSMATFPNPSSNLTGHCISQYPMMTSTYSSRTPHPVLPNSQVSENAAFYNTPTSFYLKWVNGTKVSKCCGCGGIIKNPPEKCPDDLIIFCRDIQEYRDRITGQLQRSSSAQNVHFHLRRECLMLRYPSFHVGLLSITPAF